MSGASRYLVVFARAPRFGVGKRRLAADIGRMAAYRFYRRNLIETLDRLSQGPWRLIVAVSHFREARFFPDREVMVQASGDLGRRMTTAFRDLPPGPAIIIGSDIPDIGVDDITAAFRTLGRADAVFGPAEDGGYWLVGLARRRPVPYGFMTGVRWSGPHALADTVASLAPGHSHGLAATKADVDDGAGYERFRRGRVR